jgi:hypothetical protein
VAFSPASGREHNVPSYSFDLIATILAATLAALLFILGSRALNSYQSRCLRLRMLTGTRGQRTALRLALTPVLQEFLPLLDRAGLDIRAVVVVPTLSGAETEPLAAEIERLSGSAAFIVRLAHRVGAALRSPDDLASALAENLLYLFREGAAVTVVRQTPVPTSREIPDQSVPRKAAARNVVSDFPRQTTQNEAEETVVAFKPNPLGRTNNQGS